MGKTDRKINIALIFMLIGVFLATDISYALRASINKYTLRSPSMFQGSTTSNEYGYKSFAAKLGQIIPNPLDSRVINISVSFFPEPYKPAHAMTRKGAAATSSKVETALAADFFDLERGSYSEKFPEIVASRSFMIRWADRKWMPHRKQIAKKVFYLYECWILMRRIIGSMSYVGGGDTGHVAIEKGFSIFYVVNTRLSTIFLVGLGSHKDTRDEFYLSGFQQGGDDKVFRPFKQADVDDFYLDRNGIKQILRTEVSEGSTLEKALEDFKESFGRHKQKASAPEVDSKKISNLTNDILFSPIIERAKLECQAFADTLWNEVKDKDRLETMRNMVFAVIEPDIASFENEQLERALRIEIEKTIGEFYNERVAESTPKQDLEALATEHVLETMMQPGINFRNEDIEQLNRLEREIETVIKILQDWGLLNEDLIARINQGLMSWKINFRNPYYTTGDKDSFDIALRSLKKIRRNFNELLTPLGNWINRVADDIVETGDKIKRSAKEMLPEEWLRETIVMGLEAELGEIKGFNVNQDQGSQLYIVDKWPSRKYFLTKSQEVITRLKEADAVLSMKSQFDQMESKARLLRVTGIYDYSKYRDWLYSIRREASRRLSVEDLMHSLEKIRDNYAIYLERKREEYRKKVAHKLIALSNTAVGMVDNIQSDFTRSAKSISMNKDYRHALCRMAEYIERSHRLFQMIYADQRLDVDPEIKDRLAEILPYIKIAIILSKRGPEGILELVGNKRENLASLLSSVNDIPMHVGDEAFFLAFKAFSKLINKSGEFIESLRNYYFAISYIEGFVEVAERIQEKIKSGEFESAAGGARAMDLRSLQINIPEKRYEKFVFIGNASRCRMKLQAIAAWVDTVSRLKVDHCLEERFDFLLDIFRKIDERVDGLIRGYSEKIDIKYVEEFIKELKAALEKDIDILRQKDFKAAPAIVKRKTSLSI